MKREPAPWVLEALEVERRRLASAELSVSDEWHRGKYFKPTEPPRPRVNEDAENTPRA